jgi:hypothetical protein
MLGRREEPVQGSRAADASVLLSRCFRLSAR